MAREQTHQQRQWAAEIDAEVAQEADTQVLPFQQMPDGVSRAAEVVRDDAVRVEMPRPPVDEHKRSPGAAFLVQIGVVGTCGNDDEPVYAALPERADQLPLALRILVAAPREDEDATLARGILDRAMKRRRERVRDILEHEADRLRLSAQATKRRSVRVAPVVELPDRLPDPGLELGANAPLGVDHTRDRLETDASEGGDVMHRRVAGSVVGGI